MFKFLSFEFTYYLVKISSFFRSLARSLAHPIVVFALLQIIWVSVTVAWLVWYRDVRKELRELARALSSTRGTAQYAWAFLQVGSVLLGMLLVGTVVVFAFGQRHSQNIRKQRKFFSSVTHELRSPLSSIQLAVETLRARKMDKRMTDQMYDMILTDIKRLLRLVDNVLVSARLDRGILDFLKKTDQIPLAPAIEKVSEAVTYLDKNLKSRLKISCPDDVYVQVSESTLLLVLNNLIENAVKYSQPETLIEITAATLKPKSVTLSIKDQGIGLDKHEAHQIFDMFYRTDEVIKKAISGTGLGLYIVRSTVRASGGDVWVESPGKGLGTTFFVTLPCGRKVDRKSTAERRDGKH